MSYYDIDDILTTAQKLPCSFNQPIPHLSIANATPAITLNPTFSHSAPPSTTSSASHSHAPP